MQTDDENQKQPLLRGKGDLDNVNTVLNSKINNNNNNNNNNNINNTNRKAATSSHNIPNHNIQKPARTANSVGRKVLTDLQNPNTNPGPNSNPNNGVNTSNNTTLNTAGAATATNNNTSHSNTTKSLNISHHRPLLVNTIHNHGIGPSATHNASSSNVSAIKNEKYSNLSQMPYTESQQQTQTQTKSQPQTQSEHLTAVSGMSMCSPFYTATIEYENGTSLHPAKQMKIRSEPDIETTSNNNRSISNDAHHKSFDSKILPDDKQKLGKEKMEKEQDDEVNAITENGNLLEGDDEIDENKVEVSEIDEYNDNLISMAERTEEQIQDENRRMSLKRGAPIDENSESIQADETQELKRIRVEPDYVWNDLDSGDFDDPLMVSEYVNDIFEYLHELEVKTLPDPNYLQMQRNLRPKMRSILVDWMIEVHLKFKLLPETLYLSINIMDRFLSKELVQVDRLQLLATGSLFIAAKYEEVYSPSIKNYAYVTDGAFSEDEILGAERFILEILNFNMSYPNPMNFLRRISKADDYDVNTRTIGKYLLEITVIDHKFIGYLPSLCAAASMYLSRKMIGKNDWNGNLIHYSGGYKTNDLEEVCLMVMDYLVSPIVHEEFFKKYASRKFMKVSILARQWAKKVLREGKNIMDDDF